MSSYSSTGPRRSAALVVASSLGLAGAFGCLLWGAVLLIGGKEFIKPAVAEFVDQQSAGSGLGGLLTVDDFLGDAWDTFSSRAVIWLVIGSVALIATALLFAGKGWARIVLAVFAVLAIGLALRDLTDLGPGLLKAFDVVAVVGLLGALIAQWLPGTNAAIRARKTAAPTAA